MPQVRGQPRALFLNLVFEAGALLFATVQLAHELPGPFGILAGELELQTCATSSFYKGSRGPGSNLDHQACQQVLPSPEPTPGSLFYLMERSCPSSNGV